MPCRCSQHRQGVQKTQPTTIKTVCPFIVLLSGQTVKVVPRKEYIFYGKLQEVPDGAA